MKSCINCILLVLTSFMVAAQAVRIHSHNDYQQTEPLVNALNKKVYSLEADVYLVNDELKVAHDKKDLAKAPSLSSLYLQPIIALFQSNHGHISRDTSYAPVLMIDIKENGKAALLALTKLLSSHPSVFDRSVNHSAVQVVISGDRGDLSGWTSWPAFVLFDGRISEQYDETQLQRVAFISDSYLNYTKQPDSTNSLIKHVSEKVHRMQKLLRLWAIPDNPSSWSDLLKFGVDIINTDKVAECSEYFRR